MACDYLSMLGLYLNHFSKRGPRYQGHRIQFGSTSTHRCLTYVNPKDFAWCLCDTSVCRRQMTILTSRITGQSHVCSAVCLEWQQRNIKGLHYCPWGESTVDQWITRAEKNVSIWWRHNDTLVSSSGWNTWADAASLWGVQRGPLLGWAIWEHCCFLAT